MTSKTTKSFAKYEVKYIGPGYPETVALAATKKLTVKSPADLKGKRGEI